MTASMLDETPGDFDRDRSSAAHLEGELVKLRIRASERDVFLARVEAKIEALRSMSAEGCADHTPWAAQAYASAVPPVPPAPAPRSSRGLLGWFRATRR